MSQSTFLMYQQNREFIKTKQGKPQITSNPLGCLILFALGFVIVSGISVGFVSQSLNI